MERGYLKLYRKSLDSAVWDNPKLWRFWSWCLMKASYKERTVMVGMQAVPLKPGQFVFGRKKAAAETKLSEQSCRTCLNWLKNAEKLTIKATNKYTVITVVNWGTYNGMKEKSNQQDNQGATSKQPANNHEQEGNNSNNIKAGTKVPACPAGPKCPQKKIQDLYHQILPEFPKIVIWNETSQKNLRARWNTGPEFQTLEYWEGLFRFVRQCPHLMGENERGWMPDLGWIVTSGNFQKIVNGNYEKRKGKGINSTHEHNKREGKRFREIMGGQYGT